MKPEIAAIILAAGKGTRMKSDLPKVLHPVCFRPMIGYVLDIVKELKLSESVVVLGDRAGQIEKFLPKGVKVAFQKEQKGTADAVKKGLEPLKNFKGTILVLYADMPLVKAQTIKALLDKHVKENYGATVLIAKVKTPFGYGRIIRDEYENISGIVEEKDADDFQRKINEINTGIACFNKDILVKALSSVKPDNRKKEYYLTDTIEIIYKQNFRIGCHKIIGENQALGINSRSQLARANRLMRASINEKYMEEGVSIIDPDTAFISFGTRIGRDTVIYPFTVIESDVKIGKDCSIGPFVRLRPGTRLDDGVSIGNFIEIVRSSISKGTRARHFGYIGDAEIGSNVNIGAGTVTANFNGTQKNRTRILDHAFIGSDTVMVAPVKIGKHAKTGAGSVVLRDKDVADNQVVAGVPARVLSPGKAVK